MLFPSTACLIADKIGAEDGAFDISAACSEFLYALTTASKFIESGSYKKVIVVGDKMSSMVDYTDEQLVFYLEMEQEQFFLGKF